MNIYFDIGDIGISLEIFYNMRSLTFAHSALYIDTGISSGSSGSSAKE